VRETTTVGQNSAVEELTRAVPIEPADFLRGVDLASAPLLRGYVATQPRPKPAQVILASERGDPLLARMRVGIGWSLAWTSDLEARWATDWLRWRAFPPFIAQLVREHMRERAHDELPMSARVELGQLLVDVDAIGPDDRFINGLDSTLTVTGPIGTKTAPTERTIALSQRAPGHYSARMPLDAYGSFALRAVHRRDGRILGTSTGQVSHSYPAEYAVRGASSELLARASDMSGGRTLSAPREIFDARGDSVVAHRDLWPGLVLLALLLFVADLALRRIRPAARP